MKVKCIDNGDMVYRLTVGKTYEVIDEDNDSYIIFNDKSLFE